jgi:multicomponent K+:H+ antiporter subunit G
MNDLVATSLIWLADLLSLAGAAFFLISAIGLSRLPDFFCRIHAPTKAATLGAMLLGASAMARSQVQGNFVWLEDLAILVFLFLTIPVSSQVLAGAACRRREREKPD